MVCFKKYNEIIFLQLFHSFLIGIALVLISITADSFLPNLQEKYFSKGASRSEVTFYTNLLVLLGLTVILALGGDLQVCTH